MAILSFLGKVNIADRIVTELYPDAQLYEVDATPSTPGGYTKANDMDKLRVVFNARKDGKQGTVIIKSTGWGEFGPPVFIPSPWLEDVVIRWPDEKLMEATEADELMKKAGYTGEYEAMTLRHPLVYPSQDEPEYIFEMVTDHEYIGVGAWTGTVKKLGS